MDPNLNNEVYATRAIWFVPNEISPKITYKMKGGFEICMHANDMGTSCSSISRTETEIE